MEDIIIELERVKKELEALKNFDAIKELEAIKEKRRDQNARTYRKWKDNIDPERYKEMRKVSNAKYRESKKLEKISKNEKKNNIKINNYLIL
jgi:hypothetical protein